MNELVVDDLTFEVRRSSRRRSMQITVDRGGELVFTAPDDCARSNMEDFVNEKRFWIYSKLAQKAALGPAKPLKEYRSGEGFPYLGRSYRLLLVDSQDLPVKLAGGRFRLRRDDASDGRRHMVQWYTAHAEPWLTRKVRLFEKRVGEEPSQIKVTDLGNRWGSCGRGGRLNFHWKSILLPAFAVEYIVVHELVHLYEPHHNPDFWRRVERALPDFERRKRWLAEHAADYVEF